MTMILLSVKVPPELRDAAHAEAGRRGETVSAVVRRALSDYTQPHRCRTCGHVTHEEQT